MHYQAPHRRPMLHGNGSHMTPQISSDAAPVEFLAPARPSIGVDRMLRIQGYTALDGVRRAVREAAERNAERAETLFEPAVCFRRIRVLSCSHDALTLAGNASLHCGAFMRFLSAAREVVVFASTAGARIDEELARLHAEEKLLDMLFLETAAWLGIEAITKAFVAELRQRAEADGLRLTRRMGPGYDYKTENGNADWPLQEQRALFALFGDAALPVRLLESCAMLPKMSRSGLLGLVPAFHTSTRT
jgi:hypothetical protein